MLTMGEEMSNAYVCELLWMVKIHQLDVLQVIFAVVRYQYDICICEENVQLQHF